MLDMYLNGLALDWAVGLGAGYKLKLVKAGEHANGIKYNKPIVFRYINGEYTEDGIEKLPKLVPFKPTEDWELLPEDYKEAFEYVGYASITSNNKSYDTWVAKTKIYDDGEFIEDDFIEGDNKLEVVCRAYVLYKSVNINDIPAEVIDCM